MLALTVGELRNTDICRHALDALAESRVREIHLVGRRGPVQAKFTQQEIEELGELPDCDVVLDSADLVLDPSSQTELNDPKNFNSKRNMTVFEAFAKRPAPSKRKRLFIRVLQGPVEIRGEDRVESIVMEKNRLEGDPFRLKAHGTGVKETLPCGLVFRAVGHRGVPIPRVPFDDKRGIIPNNAGRVIENGKPVPGLYAVGWIKRGPTGLIGTNKADGIETVDAILADLPEIPPCPASDSASVHALLSSRAIQVVTYDDWRRIDAAEIARGEANGKPREKLTTIPELLDAAKTAL
jgi:ferredoxin--NADP+ reductase